ncbi:MAG: geranylgeranylglycerol-phosphate geranylgeranyltransferase [Chitinophagaceae bacterium]|nr:geranylgeranylglycerol-phosphate geranylgeranyltransferase [Chitinophagaceae bacterium]
MKLISAFFRLIRWPNLVFIVVTQVLFHYCIILPSYANGITATIMLSSGLLAVLVLSSVLIAAAGYIINDYFDLNIDQVNKPRLIVVQKIIRRRWAIVWHLSLSGAGILAALFVSWKINNYVLFFANIVCVLLLWFYSTTFKKKLLLGNVIISLLTAWVIMVLYTCELNVFSLDDPAYQHAIKRIFKFAVIYAGFAFIVSLVREAIKDIEDMEGDQRYGCRTMPIVWGVQASKIYSSIWLVVVILSLVILQVYAVMLSWWLGVLYSVLLILLPLVKIFGDLYKAQKVRDFHLISSLIKLVMLTGILSMLFFLYYSL